jgi:hypothetical protein
MILISDESTVESAVPTLPKRKYTSIPPMLLFFIVTRDSQKRNELI